MQTYQPMPAVQGATNDMSCGATYRQEAVSGVDYAREALGRLTFMIDDGDELYVSIFQRQCNLVEPDGLLQKDGSSLLTFLLVHTVIISPHRCQPLRIQYAP